MNPVVSVVMAVHNGGIYLKQAIGSILAQSLTDFEFIIVDDASSDDTEQTVRSIKDQRINYVRQVKNTGQTAALNAGIRLARGSYIARMDADDIALPQRLELQAKFLKENPAIGVVGTWQETINAQGEPQEIRRFPVDPWEIKAWLVTSSPLNWYCLSHPTVMIRKSVLDKVGLYNESYRICQDYDLWVRIARHYLLANIASVGLKYRFHKKSLSQRDLSQTKKEISAIIQSNIGFYMSDISADNQEALRAMLLFDPPIGKKNILDLFECFFDRWMGEQPANKRRAFLEKMRLYYAPQLMKTKAGSAASILWTTLRHRPNLLFSKRFAACTVYSLFKKW